MKQPGHAGHPSHNNSGYNIAQFISNYNTIYWLPETVTVNGENLNLKHCVVVAIDGMKFLSKKTFIIHRDISLYFW